MTYNYFSLSLKTQFPYKISPRNETTKMLIPRFNSTYNFCEICLLICLYQALFFLKSVKAAYKDRGFMTGFFLNDEIADKGK